MGMEESCGCCCEGETKEKEKMGGMMVEIADKAWMKVVQKKLEAMIAEKNGEELDGVAKLTYEYVHKLYGEKMAGREMPAGSAEEFEKKLMEAMKK